MADPIDGYSDEPAITIVRISSLLGGCCGYLTKIIAGEGRTPVFENADQAAIGDIRRHMILQQAAQRFDKNGPRLRNAATHQYIKKMSTHPTILANSNVDAGTLAGLAGCVPGLIGDLRSDHAGETGAVAIYLGILAVARDPGIRRFAAAHLATERDHLARLGALLPAAHRSLLLPLWHVAGWLTGFLPALFGPRAVYATIDAVEIFVDQHYEEQVHKLPAHRLGSALKALLMACQADEVHHRDEARAAGVKAGGTLTHAWRWLVGTGRALAVKAARRV